MKDENNFYKKTIAEFTDIYEINCPIHVMDLTRDPDYISTTGDGNEPSRYWVFKEGVVRWADHWGKVQDCNWIYKFEDEDIWNSYDIVNYEGYGFCSWNKFNDY